MAGGTFLALYAAGHLFVVGKDWVTVVWPAEGATLALFLLFGWKLWPGIVVANVFANYVLSDTRLPVSLAVSAFGLLQFWLAFHLLRKVGRVYRSIRTLRHIVILTVPVATLVTMLHAAAAVVVLVWAGYVPASDVRAAWSAWWLSEAMSIVLVIPFVLTWSRLPRMSPSRHHRLEAVGLAGSLTLVSLLVFLLLPGQRVLTHSLAYVLFALVIWAAVRFGMHGATVATIGVSAFAVSATIREQGPFASPQMTESLLFSQAFMAAMALTGMVVSVVTARRRRAEATLQRANRALELRVGQRTSALEHARADAETANRAKSVFLATMSHELRTPLNGILGYTQILARDAALSDSHKARVGIIEGSAEHLLKLINEALDLAKIEAGKLTLERARFNLPELLSEVSQSFHPRAAVGSVRFHFTLTSALPDQVGGDERKLRQVLVNLIGNAFQFTEQGKIELRVGEAQGRIRFEVQDTGIGIPPAELDKVFLPFHQIPSSRLPAAGTGLGLAISQRMVELMGGTLNVDSSPGTGSRFWFDLTLPEVTPGGETGRRRARIPSGYHGARRRILVVDDDQVNRQIFREILEGLGLEVGEAASGEACLQLVATGVVPDLVFVDLRMAPLDGFEVARRLRHMERAHTTRIVAMSASVFAVNREEAVAAGCDAFLPKPFREAQLFAVMESLLGVRWIYDDDAASVSRPAAPRQPPSLAEIDRLLELSQQGDIVGIRERLAALRGQRSSPEFIDTVEAYAAAFQMDRIRQFLQRARDEGHAAGA